MNHSKRKFRSKQSKPRKYDHIPASPGVYIIRNTHTDTTYVGATSNLRTRIASHHYSLNCGSHHNKQLQADWHFLGERAFSFEIVELVDDLAKLNAAEQRIIMLYVRQGTCYNSGDASGYSQENPHDQDSVTFSTDAATVKEGRQAIRSLGFPSWKSFFSTKLREAIDEAKRK